MSRYRRFACMIMIIEVVLLALCNGLYGYQSGDGAKRMYRVEAKRVAAKLTEQGATQEALAGLDLSEYKTIIRVSAFRADEICNNDYVVEEIGGKLYRIEYRAAAENGALFLMNAAMLIMMLLTFLVLWYVDRKVLKPFHVMNELPYELAKGNLSVPLKEEKGRIFGRFLWGMDMLREQLEEHKRKELEFQKEKKTLLLSLSHDIWTPLSAIELYARALSGDLYDTREKKNEALAGITRNVREMKAYVDEIAGVSREDFLNLEVVQGECYLWTPLQAVVDYYRDKLSVLHTEFETVRFPDCVVRGDQDRLVEVFQNIMENAVKYGDGRSIRICGEDEEECKLVHIENTGCTLKEEELPNIFDSFYRGSNSRGVPGSGLGLYIAKNLMRKMEGEVFAQIRQGGFRVTMVIRKA